MNRFTEIFTEARLTVLALCALIIFWLLAGILGTDLEVRLYGVPMWALLGTVGVWTFAIILATTLSRNIKDADL